MSPTLRMNCIARKGEPDEDATDFGLGVEMANDGMEGLLGSGVLGGAIGIVSVS